MEARVYKVTDKAKARAVLDSDEIKRFGYVERDGSSLGVGDGLYIYIEATPEIFEMLEKSGAFERPENEEEIS
jgi:hypothetical protein